MAGDPAEEEKLRNMMVVSSSTTGFCYPDVSSSSNPNNIQTHLLSQIQSFHDSTPPEIFNLTTAAAGMDMINNFQHKNNSQLQQHHHHHHHQSFFSKHGGNNPTVVVPSSSKTAGGGFYDQQHDQNHLMAAAANNHDQDHSSVASWQDQNSNNNNNRLLVDDSSLRCVFTCERNERPSQGLSLSLSSNNPSSIGLQSFELRQQHHPTIQDLRYLSASSSNSRDGFYGKSVNNMIQHHQQQAGHHHHHQQVHIRNSKFLGPAQELLNEFCCLGSKQTDDDSSPSLVLKQNKPPLVNNQWEDDQQQQQHGSSTSLINNNNNASSKKPSTLSSLELIELQKRKAKLLSMLEEVDRRYKHYCDQMKAVVSSFEAVAGNGAAKVYSALASKAMSRHFRCLRDGIVVQIQDTKTAMGEKDPVAPGTTRGETPRLRLLDQTLRQQRALQQMTMMESHPWRPQRGLPERSVSVLRAWLFEHFLHPYPSDVDKHILARQTGLSRSQVSNWFINARVRLWKPMVEEMYLEETKDHLDNINNNNNMDSSDLPTGLVIDDFRPNQNPNTRGEDQKPTPDELVRIDSECLSSIISTNPDPKNDGKVQNQHQHQNQISFGRVVTDNAYGAMELDFSSYNHHHTGNAVTNYGHASHESAHHTFGSGGGGVGGGGVSLTLGLQQHGGSSLGLAFSPASQNSLFYSRDHIIDDCQQVQYSILDGEGQNNLPYRNLLGAQLLHDLAG